MSRSREILMLTICLAPAALMPGCRTAPPRAPDAGNVAFDPCADRLHDIGGRLLLYYSAHKDLPERLADLDKMRRDPSAPLLVCPTSGKPYVYDRGGLQVAGRAGRLILYDAEPCHSGMRWGILAEPSGPGKPLIIRVVRLPENAAVWQHPPGGQ